MIGWVHVMDEKEYDDWANGKRVVPGRPSDGFGPPMVLGSRGTETLHETAVCLVPQHQGSSACP